MGSFFAETGAILSALWSNDAWEISQALGTQGAWAAGLIVTIVGAAAVLLVYRLVPLIDRHLERATMVWTYLIIAEAPDARSEDSLCVLRR